MDPGTRKGAAADDVQPVCEDNPYEQKLYSMFCGYDKEERGWLSVNALQQLCKTLELKENGTKLISALRERCGGNRGVRVTFKEFKEELLHVLGTEVCESPQAMAERSDTKPVAAAIEDKQKERGKEDPDGEHVVSVVGDGGDVGGEGGNSIVSLSRTR